MAHRAASPGRRTQRGEVYGKVTGSMVPRHMEVSSCSRWEASGKPPIAIRHEATNGLVKRALQGDGLTLH